MKIPLDLYVEEVDLILTALGKLPLEVSVGLWAKIREQKEAAMKLLKNHE